MPRNDSTASKTHRSFYVVGIQLASWTAAPLRPDRAMIEAAEADGRLRPSGTIVEATAGNTGLGLALVGGRKGYRIVLGAYWDVSRWRAAPDK
jgi:hypothetical protein